MDNSNIHIEYKVYRIGKETDSIINIILIPLKIFTEKELLNNICNSIKENMKQKRYKMKNKSYDIKIFGIKEIKNLRAKIKRRLFA